MHHYNFHTLSQELQRCKASWGYGTIFIIALRNMSMLVSIYDKDFGLQTLTNVMSALSLRFDKLPHVVGIYDNSYGIVFVPEDKEENSPQAIDLIHQGLQFYISKDKERPVHIIDQIGSLNFKDAREDISLIDQLYLALDNAGIQDFGFYHSYEKVYEKQKFYASQMEMAQKFKESVLNQKLRFAYQPVVNAKTGEKSYYECLLRIVDDQGKLISVGPYVPVAETLGFVDVIDELVVEMTSKELRSHPEVKLSFNISGLAVDNPILLTKFKTLFRDPEIASRTVVEITETALQRDIEAATIFIGEIQETGALVALDDFGAGNSSFKQLLSLPVDIIKIDGSFIKNIVTNQDSELFVKMLLTVCQSFDIKTVAEFVENGEIAKKLIDLGIDYMQGYYFSAALNHREW